MSNLKHNVDPLLMPASTIILNKTPPHHPAQTPQSTPKPRVENSKKKNPNWSIEEDKLLCVAWLNTSRDSIVGTSQKASTFWERIYQYYSNLVSDMNEENKSTKKYKPLPVRFTNAIECRWGHIMKICNKFAGCYSQVERRMKSGKSRDDILCEAKELFKTMNDSNFNLDHCWGILKDTPKWQSTQQENELRNKKFKEAKSDSSSVLGTEDTLATSSQADTQQDDNEEKDNRSILGSDSRPEGQKKAKRKRDDDNMLEKVLKAQEELIQISKERMMSVRSALQSASDDRIMAMDLSGMDDESKSYWQKKKRAILDRPE